ncbi:hypothetical protein N7537_000274 [Penicillium hordei]|uniref:Uncharacterized protein n=1 Tax=Penicillium hordei TaxID=40994 RepID=A0AAD6EEI5_9EURO|nr:uncharacterized protein N7537_000274 [Penicillium hordei]KAJ5615160.1 hypothetical protein N7537_000274 [Penicillium hordei]
MCSIYIFEYACGCKHQEEGVVPCANQNTPACKGVKEQPRQRVGVRCARHADGAAQGLANKILQALVDSGLEAVHRYALRCHPVVGFPALSVSASR